MSRGPIERMKNRKQHLLSILADNKEWRELQKINSALKLIDEFTDDDPEDAKVTKLPMKPKRQYKRNGKISKSTAINEAIYDAIKKYNRPVTLQEIYEEVAKYGFSESDFGKNPAAHISNTRNTEFKMYRKHGGYWYKNEPIPERELTSLGVALKGAGISADKNILIKNSC